MSSGPVGGGWGIRLVGMGFGYPGMPLLFTVQCLRFWYSPYMLGTPYIDFGPRFFARFRQRAVSRSLRLTAR